VENPAEVDENKNKTIGARFRITPMHDLTLGASYYKGQKGVAKIDHKTQGVSAEYTAFPFLARAEYVTSKLGTVTAKSAYAEAAYTINRSTPFVRYNILDPDDNIGNDKWTELDLGIAYELQPSVVLKLEDRAVGGKPGNSVIYDDYNEIAAAVTVAF